MIHVMRLEGRQRKPRFCGGLGGNAHDMLHHIKALEVWLDEGTNIHWDGEKASATVGNIRYFTEAR